MSPARQPPARWPSSAGFARGEQVVSTSGQPVRLGQPLDWVAITDHSDGMGVITEIKSGNPEMMAKHEAGPVPDAPMDGEGPEPFAARRAEWEARLHAATAGSAAIACASHASAARRIGAARRHQAWPRGPRGY